MNKNDKVYYCSKCVDIGNNCPYAFSTKDEWIDSNNGYCLIHTKDKLLYDKELTEALRRVE